MDTNTILIIINLVLTIIISPLIAILQLFMKKLKHCKCCLSEADLELTPPATRQNTNETQQPQTRESNMRDIEDIIKRLSQNKPIQL